MIENWRVDRNVWSAKVDVDRNVKYRGPYHLSVLLPIYSGW